MKKIKFRVFNPSTKKMYSYESIRGKSIRYLENHKLKVMQFIGLYDKNDNEIYEGDILQYKFDTKMQISSGAKINSPGYAISKIIFKDGGYRHIIIEQENCYFGELPSKPNYITKSIRHDEIIGNIYEQPLEPQSPKGLRGQALDRMNFYLET